MQTDSPDPHKLFQMSIQYEVPLFQRPYVWNKTKQWAPLWDHIVRHAGFSAEDHSSETSEDHFMGVILLEQIPAPRTKLDRSSIVDGQQRLITLQLVIAAIRDVASKYEIDSIVGVCNRYLLNPSEFAKNPIERLKILPTGLDRDEFKAIIYREDSTDIRRNSIFHCYDYFLRQIESWIKDIEDKDSFIDKLLDTIVTQLFFVTIDIDKRNDPQEIFETLNSSGQQLSVVDLIKNYLVRKARETQLSWDSPRSNSLWAIFNHPHWRESQQSPDSRSRIEDLFRNIMLISDIELTDESYQEFKNWYITQENTKDYEDIIGNILDYSKTYRYIEDSTEHNDRKAKFIQRIHTIYPKVANPLVFGLFHRKDHINKEEFDRILDILESVIIRSAIARYRLIYPVQQEYRFRDIWRGIGGDEVTANRILEYIHRTKQLSWFDDEEISYAINRGFGILQRSRFARMLLTEINMVLESKITEPIQYDELTLEHLLPVRLARPGLRGDMNVDLLQKRALIYNLGNMTLLNDKLNNRLSYGEWNMKRSWITKHSKLALNKDLPIELDEQSISDRARIFSEIICQIWPVYDF